MSERGDIRIAIASTCSAMPPTIGSTTRMSLPVHGSGLEAQALTKLSENPSTMPTVVIEPLRKVASIRGSSSAMGLGALALRGGRAAALDCVPELRRQVGA